MPNIINKKLSSTNSVHFSNNLIEAGIKKKIKFPSNANSALSFDLFKLKNLDKIKEDNLDNENIFQNDNKFDAYDSFNFLSQRLCKI